MWTGRQTLSSIENAIANLHKEEGQLDTALRSAVAETERLRTERSEALRELARVKLDEMAAGRLVSSLDAGERRAVQILDDYRLRIAATAERRDVSAEGSSGRGDAAQRRRCGRGRGARGGRSDPGRHRGQGTDRVRLAGSQALRSRKPRPSRPKPRRRRRVRKTSWGPSASPTTTTRCSPISGAGNSARATTRAATLLG